MAAPPHRSSLVSTTGPAQRERRLTIARRVAVATWALVVAYRSVTDGLAFDRALLLLKRAKTTPEGKPLRKLIVVIGDGRDRSGDKDRVTRAGQRAAKEGVRIHALAFSPSDTRRPLLALGELSKRSLGTFRWVRAATPDSWKAAFDQLRDEIDKQYVLTYFLDPGDDATGRKLHITTVGRIEATSNELKVGEASCGGSACETGYCGDDMCLTYRAAGGHGILHWILWIGGIAVGVAVGGVMPLPYGPASAVTSYVRPSRWPCASSPLRRLRPRCRWRFTRRSPLPGCGNSRRGPGPPRSR